MIKRFIKLIDLWKNLNSLINYTCDSSKQMRTEILLFLKTITLAMLLTEDDIRQRISL